MPVWCPKCHGMLPEGLEECPRCGAPLGTSGAEGEVQPSDIFWLSAYTIGIVLIPIIVGVVIGLICIFAFLSR